MLILILLSGAAVFYFVQRLIYRRNWSRGLDIQVDFHERSAFEGDEGGMTEVMPTLAG